MTEGFRVWEAGRERERRAAARRVDSDTRGRHTRGRHTSGLRGVGLWEADANGSGAARMVAREREKSAEKRPYVRLSLNVCKGTKCIKMRGGTRQYRFHFAEPCTMHVMRQCHSL